MFAFGHLQPTDRRLWIAFCHGLRQSDSPRFRHHQHRRPTSTPTSKRNTFDDLRLWLFCVYAFENLKWIFVFNPSGYRPSVGQLTSCANIATINIYIRCRHLHVSRFHSHIKRITFVTQKMWSVERRKERKKKKDTWSEPTTEAKLWIFRVHISVSWINDFFFLFQIPFGADEISGRWESYVYRVLMAQRVKLNEWKKNAPNNWTACICSVYERMKKRI